MKNIFLIIALVSIIWSCSTKSNESSEAGAQETVQSTEQETKNTTISYPLNPNFASIEQLRELSLMNDDFISMILDNRPFLDPVSFDSLFTFSLDENQMQELRKGLFLPINLNAALEKDFLIVPGVGEKMAHEFEEYRPYTSIGQFRREIGKYVSEEEVAEYEKYVFVPVNLNTASKEEILAIPGVGDKMLHEFEEYRPYENIEQFRREIGKYVDNKELDRLVRYVTL